MYLKANGYVGVGTNAPSAILHAYKSTNAFLNGLTLENPNTGSSAMTGLYLNCGGKTLDLRVKNAASGNIGYINSSGTLYTGLLHQGGICLVAKDGGIGIGTTAPNGAKLDIRVTSASLIDAGATVNIEEDTAWTQGLALYINNADVYNADYAAACIGVANSGSNIIITSGAKVVNNPASSNGYKTLNSTAPSVYRQMNGAHVFYGDTGKTVNTLYTPTERMRIAVDGKVGIGTATPRAKLDVRGARSSDYFNAVRLANTDTGSGAEQNRVGVEFWDRTTALNTAIIGSRGSIGGHWGGMLKVRVNQVNSPQTAESSLTDMLVFDGYSNKSYFPTGSVGIGTTAPAGLLELEAASPSLILDKSETGGGALRFYKAGSQVGYIMLDADEEMVYYQPSGEGHYFYAGGQPALKIQYDGAIGIGTPSPGVVGLDVQKSSASIIASFLNSHATGYGVKFKATAGQADRYIATFNDKDDAIKATITGTGQVRSLSGAVSAPSFSFTNDTTTGMSRPTTGTLNFVTAGTERVRIAADGNVGIGTNAPLTKTHIRTAGAAIAGGNAIKSSTMKGLSITNSTNDTSSVGIWFGTSESHWAGISAQRESASTWGTDLRFYTHEDATQNLTYTSERMRIATSGSVGIGTTAPGQQLSVGNAGAQTQIYTNGSGHSVLLNNTANKDFNYAVTGTGGHWFATSGANRLNIGSDGTLNLISAKFKINGSAGSSGQTLTTDGSGNISWSSAGSGTISGSGTDNYVPRFNGTSALQNSAIFSDDNGNVGIGTTAPLYDLHIKMATGNSDLKLESDSNAGDVRIMLDSANSTRNANITFYNAGTQVGGVGYVASDTMMKMWGGNNPADDHLCINSVGSVGIGTPSPSAALEISSADTGWRGQLMIRDTDTASTAAPYITFWDGNENGSGSTGLIGRVGSVNGSRFDLWSYRAADPMTFATAGVERVRIDNTGKVGIGTTAPSNLLHVHWATGGYATLGYATNQYAGLVFVENGVSKAYIDYGGYQAADGFSFYAGGGSNAHLAMKIKESGKTIIGGGATEPGACRLTVNGSGGFGSSSDGVIISNESGYGVIQGTDMLGNSFNGLKLRTQGYAIIIPNSAAPDVEIVNKLGIGSASPAAPLDVPRASDYKVTKFGDDITSHYVITGNADHTLTLTCASYFQAEIVITAHQTNGGTYNNLYMRGIWSNNHTSHHWDEIENVGDVEGSTFTITVGQDGSTTNSGEWKIVHDYTSGTFVKFTVRVTDFYNTHSYTIS
jgi:hypothetical protein